MAAVLLDTTVLIDVLRGSPGTVSRVRAARLAGDSLYTCAVNVEEIARGLRAGEEHAARALFAGLRHVPLGERDGWQAGEWRRDLATQGQTLAQADCLIAAAALSARARLATGNAKHFPFPGLPVDLWPSGA